MGVGDAIIVILIIFTLWLSINVGMNLLNEGSEISNKLLNNSKWSNDTRENFLNKSNTSLTILKDTYGWINLNAMWLVVSFIVIIIVSNAATNLNPLFLGVFNLFLFILFYVTWHYIIPAMSDASGEIFETDYAPNFLDVFTNDFWYFFIALMFGTILGYTRGGKNETFDYT